MQQLLEDAPLIPVVLKNNVVPTIWFTNRALVLHILQAATLAMMCNGGEIVDN
jgi:hypothetical protein